MDIRPCSHNNTVACIRSKLYIFEKGKHIAFIKYHQVDIHIMDQDCCFLWCVTNIRANYAKKIGITVVGLYPRTLYKLYLHHYTKHAACIILIGTNLDIRRLCQWILRHLVLKVSVKGWRRGAKWRWEGVEGRLGDARENLGAFKSDGKALKDDGKAFKKTL